MSRKSEQIIDMKEGGSNDRSGHPNSGQRYRRSMTNIFQVCLTYADYTESPFAFHLRNATSTGFAAVRFCRLFSVYSSFDLLDIDQPVWF
ncbi:hypothetical protein E5288_WYG008618 [Bos mutus]|uniref:Uncharacterized protein n=1 Tax=Bos mutus TaxID=72004 RepID=A0A6B0S3B1_9CETA|nr:hypothetical protein [Bos mutus]